MGKYMKAFFLTIFVELLLFCSVSWAQVREFKLPLTDKYPVVKDLALSFDGNSFIYLLKMDSLWKMVEAERDAQGNWSTPTMMDSINGLMKTGIEIEGISISNDENRLYFGANLAGGVGGYDIYYTKRKGGVWSKPINVGAPINTAGDETAPSISVDNHTLFFARKNAKQNPKLPFVCKSIFIADRDLNGNWQEPVQMPKPFNLGCEDAPKMAADNNTLVFSSVREEGMGAFDLYYTKRLAKDMWLLPIKIDTANTELNDVAGAISSKDSLLYYTVNNQNHSFQNRYVYKSACFVAPLLPAFRPDPTIMLHGVISDLNTTKPLGSGIVISDPFTSEIISEFENNDQTGMYNLSLLANREYRLDYYKENYSHDFFNFSTKDKIDKNILSKDVKLYSTINLIFNVFDKERFEPIAGKITVFDVTANVEIRPTINLLKPGRYNVNLPIGKKYKISLEKENFESFGIEVDLAGVIQFDEFERDVALAPVLQNFEIDVADRLTSENIDAQIEITDLENNETFIVSDLKNSDGSVGGVSVNEKGKYTVKLRQGGRYTVNVKNPKGYFYYSTKVDLSSENDTRKLDVKLDPILAHTQLELKNITFETNSADLNSSSFEELDRGVKLLTDNPNIKIEIAAHTDNVGSPEYNIKLSDKRAQSVINYYIDKGIFPQRLVAKGYGLTKPVALNDTEENRAKNRRVELKILDIKNN